MHYLLAILEELVRAAIWLALGYLLALGTALAIADIYDHWDTPEHPHSGFTPEYHTAHSDDSI